MRERKREREREREYLKLYNYLLKQQYIKSFQYYRPQLNIKINIFPDIHEKK